MKVMVVYSNSLDALLDPDCNDVKHFKFRIDVDVPLVELRKDAVTRLKSMVDIRSPSLRYVVMVLRGGQWVPV